MRTVEIESWVHNINTLITNHHNVEDSRVELKGQFPEPYKAARRIAGHANAANGDPILWIIGLDQEKGVVGCPQLEMANWWPQVVHYFEPFPPHLTELMIPIGSMSVLAMLFETDRFPYLVKNPVYGKPEAGPVELEIPWRDGTSIRSARHSDLIRMFDPLNTPPFVEVLDMHLTLNTRDSTTPEAWLTAHLYVAATEHPFILPAHRCLTFVSIPPDINEECLPVFILQAQNRSKDRGPSDLSVLGEYNEIIVKGAGAVDFRAKGTLSRVPAMPTIASVKLCLSPIGTKQILITAVSSDDPSSTPKKHFNMKTSHDVGVGV